MRKIVFSFLLLLGISVAYSQVKRSDNLIAISGKKHYLHQVEAKQTMYGISKAYGLSISKILEFNHKKTTNLQEGELLKIPYAEPATVVQSLKYKHYIVKKGDTLYSLAKKFGTTQEELVTLNAGVEVALVEGRRLIVPIILEGQPRYDDTYYYHIVKSKETLSSIGRRYGVGMRKLKKLNKDINPKRLQPGNEVRIPSANARAEIAAIRMVNRKTKGQREVLVVKDDSEQQGTLTQIPEGWNPNEAFDPIGEEELEKYTADFKDSYKMLLLLPLKNSFPGMTNYYKGMLLAMQENGDVPVTVHVYDSERSKSTVQNHLQNHKDADFIVGPYSQKIFPAALPYANSKTTLVSLLSKNDAVFENANVLQLNTTEHSVNKKIAEYVVSKHLGNNVIYFNGNNFCTYRDTTTLTSDKIKNLAHLIDVVQDKGNTDNKDYEKELESLVKKTGKNVIIVPESDYRIVNKVLNVLNVFSMNDVEVIGYYKWKLLPNIDPEMLFNLNVMYFTPFHYVPSEQVAFRDAYKERFSAFPDEFSYMGYETMRKLLKGIKIGGHNFYKRPLQKIQKHPKGGYENIDLYKVQFRDDFKIIAE